MSESRMWTTPLIVSLFALPLALCESGSPGDVRLPPTIVKGPTKGGYYRNDNAFTLECKAYGVPEITYEWKKNGGDFNLNGHNVKREVDGTITITPGRLDEGFYQCIARNQYGTALSNTSFMQMAVLDSKGNTQVFTKTVTEGEPFCVEAHPVRSVPKSIQNWQMASSPVDTAPSAITRTKRIQINENGDLCFAFAKTEDDLGGKIYKINEFNERLDLTTGGSYTKVTVNRVAGGPKQFAPTLGFSSQAQTVAVEGQNVTLRCFFYGNPEPNLEWRGPKNTLPVGRNTLSHYNSQLTLQNVQPIDEGDYHCSGRNEKGNDEHRLQIRVEAVPRFLSKNDQPHDKNVTEGATLTFKCQTYAKPEATVVWLKNGELLDLNNLPKRYRISTDKKSLTIADLCRDCPDRPASSPFDLGIIQCNASNVHGYAFGAGYVNVLVKTSVLFTGEKEVSVDMDEEKEITWECKATSDPSTPPTIKWFKETKDGDQRVYEEAPVILLKDGALTIHVVPTKNQSWVRHQGKYRCDGDNNYTKESVRVVLKIKDFIIPDEAGIDWWIILLVVLFLLLLLIIICICCICLKRNKGDVYDVDEKERKNGHDPEKEILNDGFQDYQRPEVQNRKGSRGSLDSVGKLHSDDEASLMAFGDDPGKFTEDGSFVGAYASNPRGRME